MRQSQQGYSVILATIMVGFMILLTHGVLSLVMTESRDSKAMENYLRAYAGAEGALELGMLEAKNKNYGLNVKNTQFREALFTYGGAPKDVEIQYEVNGATQNTQGIYLGSGEFAIIPLFWEHGKMTQPRIEGLNDQVVWNLLSKDSGLAGVGNFDKTSTGKEKSFQNGQVSLRDKNIELFLQTNENNYLILQNTSSESISYSISSDKIDEYFTKNRIQIIGTAEVLGYKQNVFVEIDAEKYLNLLKYSVFYPN